MPARLKLPSVLAASLPQKPLTSKPGVRRKV